MLFVLVPVVILLLYVFNCIKILREYERGVIFSLGRLQQDAKGPGLILVFPPIQKMVRIDLRQQALEVPPQDIITRDNVTLKVNAVIYWRVVNAPQAVVQVQNYYWQTQQFAQTTLRSVLGEVELDELLARYPGETNPERISLDFGVPHPALAQGKVRYVGDHVAVVIADTLTAARDAAELVAVEYEALPASVDTATTQSPGKPQIHAEAPLYEAAAFRPWRVVALAFKVLRKLKPDYALWRDFAYEYERDRLAIDLINGDEVLRRWVDDAQALPADLDAQALPAEASWRAEREAFLIYR